MFPISARVSFSRATKTRPRGAPVEDPASARRDVSTLTVRGRRGPRTVICHRREPIPAGRDESTRCDLRRFRPMTRDPGRTGVSEGGGKRGRRGDGERFTPPAHRPGRVRPAGEPIPRPVLGKGAAHAAPWDSRTAAGRRPGTASAVRTEHGDPPPGQQGHPPRPGRQSVPAVRADAGYGDHTLPSTRVTVISTTTRDGFGRGGL